MILGNDTFLFYIVDSTGVCWYVNDQGQVVKGGIVPLKHAPNGWPDMQITWSRNNTYQGLDRTYSDSFQMAKDGAKICRYLLYNPSNNGYETKAWMVITKLDNTTGIHEIYYRAEIDFTQIEDHFRDFINLSLIEGEATKCIKTNENTTYEFNKYNASVYFDGVLLYDTDNWQSYVFEIGAEGGGYYAIPMVFLNNEGDSIGVELNGQQPERIGAINNTTTYFDDSPNYFFRDIAALTGARVFGTIKYTPTSIGTAPGTFTDFYLIRQSDDRSNIQASAVHLGSKTNDAVGVEQTITFDVNFDVVANDKCFIVVLPRSSNNPGDPDHRITMSENTKISMQIETIAAPTSSKAYTSLALFQELCQRISDSKYVGVSSFLSSNNVLLTSGDNLRNIPKAVIKTTFRDFFDSFSKEYDLALGVRDTDQAIILEQRSYFYDNNIEIVDIGEVENLLLNVANDLLANTIKVGYPDQTYDQRAGKQEFNSQQQWSLPITRVQKEFDLTIPYRADCYGIEFMRKNYDGKETTDSSSDNNVFIVDCTKGMTFENVDIASAGSNAIKIDNADVYARRMAFKAGDHIIISGTASYNGTYTVTQVTILQPNILVFFVQETVSGGFSQFGMVNFPDNYNLNRPLYDSITGVNTSTVFNVELSPKRMLLRNSSYWRAICYGTPTQFIKFQSALKNAELVTTLNGVTIAEKADVRLNSLPRSFYYPLYLTFDTKVPQNIIKLLKNVGKGYISLRYNGQPIRGFVQDVSVKPSFNDSQQWKILLSSLTNPAIFEQLPLNTFITNTSMYSNAMPLELINSQGSTPYNTAIMGQAFWLQRQDQFKNQNPYYQKWQKADKMPIQFYSKNDGAFTIKRYENGTWVFVDTVTPASVSNPGVINPWFLFQGEIDWSFMPDGVYIVEARFGAAYFWSEPILLKDYHDGTMLIEYTNSENSNGVFWNQPFSTRFRVEAILRQYEPLSRYAAYNDEGMDRTMLTGGESYDTYEILFGAQENGLPDWVFKKLNIITLLDTVMIDGVFYARNDDGENIELAYGNGSNFAYGRMRLRKMLNTDGIDIDEASGGLVRREIVEEYNINTVGFSSDQSPNPDQTDNVVQVIRIS